MSERSIYLRDQADKCRRHASAISDAYTQTELRKLAEEYIARADEIESKETESESKPPHLNVRDRADNSRRIL